jgi:uncharacterized protein (TIGR04255 family)
VTNASPADISELVTFADPPVGEVAISVQLAGPVADATVTLGQFWPRINGDYPLVETQPVLPPISEDFGPAQLVPSISFQLLGPASRYWLLSADATELVQVQPDRFGYNWRKEPVEKPYPRYRYIRQQFVATFSEFIAAVETAGGTVQPTWCEVTYINPIPSMDADRELPDLSRILRRISPHESSVLPQRPQGTTLAERFLLSRDGVPYGRFYLSVNTGLRRTDQMPMHILTLTARALAASPDLTGVLTVLDEGRDLIVRSFREITTEEMHELWGLSDD